MSFPSTAATSTSTATTASGATMEPNASVPSSNMLNAVDFFGNESLDAVDKFKIITLRALQDQQTEEELRQARLEIERLKQNHTSLLRQCKDIETNAEIQKEEQERLLLHKTKKNEELLAKIKDLEQINQTLLLSMNGTLTATGTGENGVVLGRPVYHAVASCKETEYKQLYEEKITQMDLLYAQIAQNEQVMQEMVAFQLKKHQLETTLKIFEQNLEKEKEESKTKIEFLERKLLMETERLKMEKLIEIQNTKEEMEKQIYTQLDLTTKKTIEENTKKTIELRYQSNQIEKLLKENGYLLEKKSKIYQEKKNLQEMITKMTSKIHFYEKMFQKLQHAEKQQAIYLQQQQQQNSVTSPRVGNAGVNPFSSGSNGAPNGATHQKKQLRWSNKGHIPNNSDEYDDDDNKEEDDGYKEGARHRKSMMEKASPSPPSDMMEEFTAIGKAGRGVTRTGQNMSRQFNAALEACGDEVSGRLKSMTIEDEDERMYREAKKQMELVSKELEEHLQDRSFTRRQVEALIHFTTTSPIKHHQHQQHYKMKPKDTYAPSTYGKGKRKLKETPSATFKNFLHAKPPPPQQQGTVPALSTYGSKVKTPSSKDKSIDKEAMTSMWSSSSSSSGSSSNSNSNSTSSKLPVTARF